MDLKINQNVNYYNKRDLVTNKYLIFQKKLNPKLFRNRLTVLGSKINVF